MRTAAREAASLTLRALCKQFDSHLAVSDMNLHVEPGEMIVLLGPSGCGKTTTLRMIAGFATVSSGDILVDGSSILDLPAHRRDMGIVFQSYALFPHLTVARNVRFGLEMRRMPEDAAARRVAEMLRLVKLDGFAERLPRSLSGGQQQRVALARALAIHPRLLLLDEPLSNLDAALRQDMAREIRILQRDGGITAIVVTHDQGEAMAMADRLVVMCDGRVEQIGRQEDLYERPASPFVAGFIGQSNLIAGRLDGAAHLLADDGGPIALAGHYRHDGRATLAVRPESIRLAPPGAAGGRVEGMVKLCTYLGAVLEHVVRLDSGRDIIVRGPGLGPDAAVRWAPDERVSLNWSAAAERVFDDRDQPAANLAEDATIMTEQGERACAATR
ncbi:MAG TPA: ABC transporter ATP-binding protein [Stellaceae bacterium]|jgi:putative spermidine/putrescine transport system ATP-binding protein|nr:ABC transporter ATP-binding protein [Stellaceae bacterium]